MLVHFYVILNNLVIFPSQSNLISYWISLFSDQMEKNLLRQMPGGAEKKTKRARRRANKAAAQAAAEAAAAEGNEKTEKSTDKQASNNKPATNGTSSKAKTKVEKEEEEICSVCSSKLEAARILCDRAHWTKVKDI